MFITQRQETQKPIEHKFDSHIWQVLLENTAKWGTVRRPMALNSHVIQILALKLLSLSQP